MFTGTLVRLADFDARFSLSVVRDAGFAFVGKIPTQLKNLLVPCASARHIAEAAARRDIVAVVTLPELAGDVPETLGLALSPTPQASAWLLHEHIARVPGLQWSDFPSRIAASADVRPGAHVASRNVVIGDHTVVMPGAVVSERSLIGANCHIGPGTVIGCEAFEVDTGREPQVLLGQAGGVMIGDHVSITGHSTLARATFGGFTTLEDEVMLDCHVYVAHDCRIGPRVRIAACADLSGRVNVGRDSYIGPNCTISNGINIGDGATVTLGAVVVRDVPPGERVTGHFAVEHRKWLRFIKPNA